MAYVFERELKGDLRAVGIVGERLDQRDIWRNRPTDVRTIQILAARFASASLQPSLDLSPF